MEQDEQEQYDAKAGARHSRGDQQAIQAAHDAIVKAGAACADPNDHTAMAAKGEDLPAGSPESIAVECSIKAVGDRILEVKVAYGGPNNGKDAHGEYFDGRTDFDEDNYPTPPAAYYHGYDANGRKMQRPAYLGKVARRESRDDGLYLYVPLKKNAYADRVWDAAMKGQAVASPGTVGHLRSPAAKDGHIEYWPLAEISVWDYDGTRKPANAYSVATPMLKALYDEAGIALPAQAISSETPSLEAEPTGATAQRGDATATATAASPISSKQEKTPIMDEKELQKLIAEQAQAAAKALFDAREAEAKAKQEEDARIEAMVKARVEEQMKAAKAEAAAGRRLPDSGSLYESNQAPYVAKFADVRKYDHLAPEDLSLGLDILSDAKKRGKSVGGVSAAAAKALAIKYSEGKDSVCRDGQNALKAAGFDPGDALNAAKANELNYTTQTGYGDEWIGAGYSNKIWEVVRAESFLMQNLPMFEMPAGVESMTIPLESTDPTWYKVSQTTATNGTTGRPDASISSSKVATGNDTVTLSKAGARVVYSGEMEEDNLFPFVAQLRAQLEKSSREQLEAAMIDGDTVTTSSNINNASGSTLTNNLFLIFNGFRKSPLVTTTANSRSASGTLADTDFLETVYLMGTAGVVGADRTKVAFIIDPNVNKKALQLASVKTRDVFENATLENGMLSQIWGYPVYTSYFMHYSSAKRMANTSGKVDVTDSSNTTGSILAVRWDQWQLWWRRRLTVKTQELIDSDSTQIVATLRLGLVQRDTEGAAISYNVGV